MITTAAPVPAGRGGGASRRLVALAVLAGVTFAALGAGAGAWLGWRDVPPMAFGTAERLAAVVAPDTRPEIVDSVRPVGSWVNRGAGTAGVLPVLFGDAFGTGYEQVVLRGAGTTAGLAAARSRLAAEGWTTDRADDGGEATRDGLHLAVRAPGNPGGGAAAVESVTLTVQRDEPDGVLPLALVGAAAGAVLGAVATLLLGRRSPVVRAAIFAVGVVLLGVTVTGLGGLGMRLTGVELSPDSAQREGIVTAAAVVTWAELAGIALAVAGVVLAIRRRRVTPLRMRARPRRAGGSSSRGHDQSQASRS
jgi:hypothetical protein